MRTCIFCKGEVTPRRVQLDARWGDRLVIIKEVPAEVCIQCGEEYFSPEVSRRIDELVQREVGPGEPTIQVPVRIFTEEAGAHVGP